MKKKRPSLSQKRKPSGPPLPKKSKILPCLWCPFTTNNNYSLTAHLLLHTGEKPFTCDFPGCTQGYTRFAHLKRHRRGHDPEESYSFQCSTCAKKFVEHHSLVLHLKTHSDDRPFPCPQCPYRAKYKNDLVQHERFTHSDLRPFKCDHCGFAGKTLHLLNLHRRVHPKAVESKEEKRHACHLCPYKFRNSSDLGRHVRTHTKEKPYACQFCDYRTSLRASLKNHLIGVHKEGEKKFKCSFCTYSTVTSGNLCRHIRKHIGEKPWGCPVEGCDYTSRCASSIKIHKGIHDEEKAWKCQWKGCDYASNWKGNLRDHLDSHKVGTPYKCKECKYKGKSKKGLQRHVKIYRHEVQWEPQDRESESIVEEEKGEGIAEEEEEDEENAIVEEEENEEEGEEDVEKVIVKEKAEEAVLKEEKNHEDANLVLAGKCKIDHCKFWGDSPKDLAIHLDHFHKLPVVLLARVFVGKNEN